jgi:hypothetical protein
MLVRQQDDTVNPAVTFAPSVLDAHSLAHARVGKAVRAVIAADIADGLIRVSNIPLWILSLLMRVSVAYIVAARRLTPDQRRGVRCRMRPLVLSRQKEPVSMPAPVVIEPGVAGAMPDSARSRFLHLVDEIGGVDAALSVLAGEGAQLAA